MKITFTTLLFIAIYCSTFGQVDQTDTVILAKVFKQINSHEQIVYVDRVDISVYLQVILKKEIEKRKLSDNRKPSKANTLILTKAEEKYLLDQIAKKTVWQDNLFFDSKRIDKDSVQSYWKKENTKRFANLKKAALNGDSLTFHKLEYDYPYVFSFTKPVYIREGTICLICFTARCGHGCGQDEISFYKKENNEWKKWIVISSSDI